MKVLIISAEVWQDSMNGGNVLSNIFSESGFEFAQIYCNPGTPQNDLCRKYYQMTDSMAIRNVLKKGQMGRAFELSNCNKEQSDAEQPNKGVYAFFHKHRWGIFYAAKDIAWNLCDWKNERLLRFLDEFNPDIIFAPCYGNSFMLKLTRFVVEHTGKKVISYISDDSYTLKQFSLSPYFWINRFIVRRQMRKTFPYYSLVYTMTEEQKQQCEHDLHANMKILRKSNPFKNIPIKERVSSPVRIIYAGGIYLNRWKTLRMLAKEIAKINSDGEYFKLDIYTANESLPKINRVLNDGKNSCIHSAISQQELARTYQESDIALHVESFDLKNRLLVRMSFSTKIVDCLSSGCAVMAICDRKQAGYNYLKMENAAFCANSASDIKKILKQIKYNPKCINEYAGKARRCCSDNHASAIIKSMVKNDFENILNS